MLASLQTYTMVDPRRVGPPHGFRARILSKLGTFRSNISLRDTQSCHNMKKLRTFAVVFPHINRTDDVAGFRNELDRDTEADN